MYKISRNEPGALAARCEGTEAAFVLAKSIAIECGEAIIEDTLRGRTFKLCHLEDESTESLRAGVVDLLEGLAARTRDKAA